MRTNLPVIDQEYDYPANDMLVSMTDIKGIITHCNPAFVRTSGYAYEELIGQPHNLIRHPDMPPAAFKDLWRTIGTGQLWTAMVKNRRKDGSYYWVRANVTPLMENGKPAGYVSVRVKPSREETRAAQALYDRMNAELKAGQPSFTLLRGKVRAFGLRGFLQKWQDVSQTARMGIVLAIMALLGMLPLWLGVERPALGWWQAGGMVFGAALGLRLFSKRYVGPILEAEQFARDIAACNLSSEFKFDPASPFAGILNALNQIQVNLRATIGDVRDEIQNFNRASSEISSASLDLSARTEAQASNLEETAASMEELSSTVKNTAQTAADVLQTSEQTTAVATQGGQAVYEVSQVMGEIDKSSHKMREIISVIEGIAFQTNILALNAAVEAARAGEQGRGFAVVATEVRALAQRSATAAKEIRELIAQSANQIANGTGKMQHANQTIDETVKAVRQVSAMVQQISTAAREQSTGIAQVNEAITQLDQLTQQNAAMAEESAASADGLKDSAASLAKSMQVFRLR